MNQLKQGIKIEMEHKGLNNWMKKYTDEHKRFPKDSIIAKQIAKEHLKEDRNYYTKLNKAKL
jgi:hypothetical protein